MRIAIMGCGQLSRMLALAGWPLGFEFNFLAEPGETTHCVAGLGNIVAMTEDMTTEAVYKALGRPDVMTIEREAVDVALLRKLTAFCPVYPDPEIAWTIQNRHREKTLVHESGIPTSPWVRIDCDTSIRHAIDHIGGLPVVIKSTEDGYDGHNQWVIDKPSQIVGFEAERARILEGESDHRHTRCEWIVERKIPFEREISVIGARNVKGDISCYVPGENLHRQGILMTSVVPAPGLSESLRKKAIRSMSMLLEQSRYVGVLAMELFVVGDELVVNELAPRVHNSGHWTMNGAKTSQFENHIRAIANLPIGDTQHYGIAGMYNLLGKTTTDITDAPDYLIDSDLYLHWYGKTSRHGRKLGHVNVLATDKQQLAQRLGDIERMWLDTE